MASCSAPDLYRSDSSIDSKVRYSEKTYLPRAMIPPNQPMSPFTNPMA